MNDKICINYNTFILFMIIIIGIFYLFFKDISQSQNINLKKIIINNEEKNLMKSKSKEMKMKVVRIARKITNLYLYQIDTLILILISH